jgi:hypothetical protein
LPGSREDGGKIGEIESFRINGGSSMLIVLTIIIEEYLLIGWINLSDLRRCVQEQIVLAEDGIERKDPVPILCDY